MERKASPIKIHNEGREADTRRHTRRGFHYFLDVDGTENSEKSRSGGMAVPHVWNALLGHYLRNWLEWENVEYAVTNRRTVIRRGLWRVFEVSRPHSDSPIEVRASTDGAVGAVIFQPPGKPNLTRFSQQISSMFNPELRTKEFGLYGLENPGNVYRIILAQTSAAPTEAEKSV